MENENKIFLRIPRRQIAFLTKIIEGYDNLGVVSTIDSQEGIVMIHLTPDTRQEILGIVTQLPFVQEVSLAGSDLKARTEEG